MAEYDSDVIAESSPADSSQGSAPGQAPSTPESTAPGQGGENRIPLSRFNEAIWRERQHRAAAEARAQAYQEQLRHAMSQPRPEPPPAPRPPLPDGWDPAGNTLRELMDKHPAFERLRLLEQLGPVFAQTHLTAQQVQQQMAASQQAQTERYVIEEHNRLGQMVRAAGMPADPEDVEYMSDVVARVIARNPEAVERYRQGDRSILDAAFAYVRQRMDTQRRSQGALAQTKRTMQGLPPRSGVGGAPGVPAPPKFDVNDPHSVRQAWERTHMGARAHLTELLSGG